MYILKGLHQIILLRKRNKETTFQQTIHLHLLSMQRVSPISSQHHLHLNYKIKYSTTETSAMKLWHTTWAK